MNKWQRFLCELEKSIIPRENFIIICLQTIQLLFETFLFDGSVFDIFQSFVLGTFV